MRIMTKFSLAAVLLYSLLAFAEEPEALLVGIEDKSGLSTYLVTEKEAVLLGSGIAAPSKSGWFRLGYIEKEVDGISLKYVGVGSGKKPLSPPNVKAVLAQAKAPPKKECTGSSTEELNYVDGKWMSLVGRIEVECGDGKWLGWRGIRTVQLDPKRYTGKSVSVETALGKTLANQMMKPTDQKVRADEWGMDRTANRWMTLFSSKDVRYSDGRPVPIPFQGESFDTSPYQTVVEDMRDGVASPSGRLKLMVGRKQIVALVNDASIGSFEHDDAKIRMTLVAKGTKEIERWKREASALLKAAAP
jgi:hypothetical protein